MAIKVLIHRRVSDVHAGKMRSFLSALELWASKHTGYFYGENLENPEAPGEYLSIGTWQSIEAFDSYAQSTPARKLELQMTTVLGMRSESTIYVRQSQP